MSKKTTVTKNLTDRPPFIDNIIEKVLSNLDMDATSASLAAKLSDRIASALQIDRVVDQIFEKYGEQVQASLTDAIVARL